MKQQTKRLLKAAGLGALHPAKARRGLRELRHVADEVSFRIPNPLHRLAAIGLPAGAVRALKEDGLVALPSYVSGERLSQMQEAFNRMIEGIEASGPSEELLSPDGGGLHPSVRYREEQFDPDIKTTHSHDPFKHDVEFLRIALDPVLIGILDAYFGRSFLLQQVIASRYYPMEPRDFGSWQWHHDSWGKRVNVMLLLTDVDENDQYMSYLKGSHKLVHPRARYRNSRFTEDEVSGKGFASHKCLGPAGTVFLFDSNGLHRGNRSLGRHRDSIIWNCGRSRYVWRFRIPREFRSTLTADQIAFLERNPRIEYM